MKYIAMVMLGVWFWESRCTRSTTEKNMVEPKAVRTQGTAGFCMCGLCPGSLRFSLYLLIALMFLTGMNTFCPDHFIILELLVHTRVLLTALIF